MCHFFFLTHPAPIFECGNFSEIILDPVGELENWFRLFYVEVSATIWKNREYLQAAVSSFVDYSVFLNIFFLGSFFFFSI